MSLEAVVVGLRQLRVAGLAEAASGVLSGRIPRDAAVTELQQQLDRTRAALRAAEADLVAVRNLNQRLLVENSAEQLEPGQQVGGDRYRLAPAGAPAASSSGSSASAPPLPTRAGGPTQASGWPGP